MIALLLALATYAAPTPQVDRMEVNRYRDQFTQVVFWSWSEQRRRYDVRAWMLVKDESHYPVRTRDGYRVVWYEGETRYEVRAKSRIETQTPYDPELREREKLSQEQRKPIFESPK